MEPSCAGGPSRGVHRAGRASAVHLGQSRLSGLGRATGGRADRAARRGPPSRPAGDRRSSRDRRPRGEVPAAPGSRSADHSTRGATATAPLSSSCARLLPTTGARSSVRSSERSPHALAVSRDLDELLRLVHASLRRVVNAENLFVRAARRGHRQPDLPLLRRPSGRESPQAPPGALVHGLRPAYGSTDADRRGGLRGPGGRRGGRARRLVVSVLDGRAAALPGSDPRRAGHAALRGRGRLQRAGPGALRHAGGPDRAGHREAIEGRGPTSKPGAAGQHRGDDARRGHGARRAVPRRLLQPGDGTDHEPVAGGRAGRPQDRVRGPALSGRPRDRRQGPPGAAGARPRTCPRCTS